MEVTHRAPCERSQVGGRKKAFWILSISDEVARKAQKAQEHERHHDF